MCKHCSYPYSANLSAAIAHVLTYAGLYPGLVKSMQASAINPLRMNNMDQRTLAASGSPQGAKQGNSLKHPLLRDLLQLPCFMTCGVMVIWSLENSRSGIACDFKLQTAEYAG